MILSFIVAISDNNAIGIDNHLPWHLPEDMKFFKRTTMGKPMIMGRKTFNEFGKLLPGRLNIILSTNPDFVAPAGALVFGNIDAALERMQAETAEEGFIIGGGKIFERTINLVDRMYVTHVHTTVPDADTFFPNIDHTHWKPVWEEKHLADDRHKYDYTFRKYERVEL